MIDYNKHEFQVRLKKWELERWADTMRLRSSRYSKLISTDFNYKVTAKALSNFPSRSEQSLSLALFQAFVLSGKKSRLTWWKKQKIKRSAAGVSFKKRYPKRCNPGEAGGHNSLADRRAQRKKNPPSSPLSLSLSLSLSLAFLNTTKIKVAQWANGERQKRRRNSYARARRSVELVGESSRPRLIAPPSLLQKGFIRSKSDNI